MTEQNDIWAGETIEVIGLTGEFESGKTLFGLTIDPKRTLCIDAEKSASVYEKSLGFDRIDLINAAREDHGDDYTPLQLYLTFWRIIQEATSTYSVWLIDPVSEIEEGLAAYVTAHPEEFGYTKAQFARMSGLKWGAVKGLWKRVLAVAAEKCQTLVFTSHLRLEWKGDRPTRNKIPKGKETLMELATLYLWMERSVDDSGRKPLAPSAKVLKSRLSHAQVDDAGVVSVVPMLPPRLPVATPAAIRAYIETPPNYKKLKKGELTQPEKMAEDERLELEASMLADRRAIAEVQAGRPADDGFAVSDPKKVAVADRDHKPHDPSEPPWIEPGTNAAEKAVAFLSAEDLANEAKQPANGEDIGAGAEEEAPAGDLCTPEQLRDLLDLKSAMKIDDDTWTNHILASRGAALPVELPTGEAQALIEKLKEAAEDE